jgi:hypothetical protein
VSRSFARSVLIDLPILSYEGFRSPKENHMSRNATYVKFALLMLLLVALAMFMGSEPWGPI